MPKIKWEDKKCGCGCGRPADYKATLTFFYAGGHYARVLDSKRSRGRSRLQTASSQAIRGVK